MDLPTVHHELKNLLTDFPKETFAEPKLTDSLSSLQNSSEFVLSNFHEEIPNSDIQTNKQPVLDSQSPLKLEELENKNIQSEDDSSHQSGQQELKGVVKSGREQKFKRSTNNSHKKFISVARRWLFKNHRGELKVAFQNKFHNFRSTRTYFFIILAFIRTIMNEQKQRQFQTHFTKQVSFKILEYEKQIENTTNENLKHFRSDEVTDLKFSIKACDVYFEGDLDKSIECVYKKDKTTIVKKHHYEQALKTVRGIQAQFKDPNFLENTVLISLMQINMYGGKKLRMKSIGNDEPWIRNKDRIHDKEPKSRFLVAEMFGLKVGYVTQTFYNSKQYREMRRKQSGEVFKSVGVQEMKMQSQSSKQAEPVIVVDQRNGWADGKKILGVILVSVSKKTELQTASNFQQAIIDQENKIEEQQ